MQFKKFPSIENAYRTGFVQKILLHEHSNCPFVVVEKIHGSNLGIYTDGKEIQIAKRTSFVAENEFKGFFNADKTVQKYFENVKMTFDFVRETHPNVTYITIFGELFGGDYLHLKPTDQQPKPTRIAKGVHYCPHNDFFVFDCRIHFEDGRFEFFPFDECVALFKRAKFPVGVSPLFRGTLNECLEWSSQHNADQTIIPSIFNLPPIENNSREGHVIRPIQPFYIGDEFAILKDKNPRFAEKTGGKAHKSNCQQQQQHDNKQIYEILAPYFTDERFASAQSKIGQVTKKDFGELMKLISKDVTEEIAKDGLLSSEEHKKAAKQCIQQLTRQLILKNL